MHRHLVVVDPGNAIRQNAAGAGVLDGDLVARLAQETGRPLAEWERLLAAPTLACIVGGSDDVREAHELAGKIDACGIHPRVVRADDVRAAVSRMREASSVEPAPRYASAGALPAFRVRTFDGNIVDVAAHDVRGLVTGRQRRRGHDEIFLAIVRQSEPTVVIVRAPGTALDKVTGASSPELAIAELQAALVALAPMSITVERGLERAGSTAGLAEIGLDDLAAAVAVSAWVLKPHELPRTKTGSELPRTKTGSELPRTPTGSELPRTKTSPAPIDAPSFPSPFADADPFAPAAFAPASPLPLVHAPFAAERAPERPLTSPFSPQGAQGPSAPFAMPSPAIDTSASLELDIRPRKKRDAPELVMPDEEPLSSPLSAQRSGFTSGSSSAGSSASSAAGALPSMSLDGPPARSSPRAPALAPPGVQGLASKLSALRTEQPRVFWGAIAALAIVVGVVGFGRGAPSSASARLEPSDVWQSPYGVAFRFTEAFDASVGGELVVGMTVVANQKGGEAKTFRISGMDASKSRDAFGVPFAITAHDELKASWLQIEARRPPNARQ